MKLSGSDGKKVIWEGVDDHIVDEGNEPDKIVILGFGFNFLTNMRRGWLYKD